MKISTLALLLVSIFYSLPALCDSCWIYVPNHCQNNYSVNTWNWEGWNGSSSNQIVCMQRAQDYQSWCGTDAAYASYWTDSGVGSWTYVVNGKPQQFSLPAGTGMPLDNIYSNPGGVLFFQNDGNLVSYENGVATWVASQMSHFNIPQGPSYWRNCGSFNCVATLQGDGNLVLYNPGGNSNPYGAYWSSNTWGNPGARLLLYTTTPTAMIVNGSGATVWSSLSEASGVIQSLNNRIRSGDASLDYVIQDVCVDGFDHPISGDPANCASHRNVRIGEKVPYLTTDRDCLQNGTPVLCNSVADPYLSHPRYQAMFNYPAPGTDGTLKVVVSKTGQDSSGANPLDSSFRFRYNPSNDGYDLLDTNGPYISGIRTSDPGCIDQKISLNGNQRSGGWLVFPIGSGELSSGLLNHGTSWNILGANQQCQSGQTSEPVQDIWNQPGFVTFDSGKTLSTIITYHLANADSSRENNAIERVFWTKEYGFTRWEAWIPYSRCMDANFSGSPASKGMPQLCEPTHPNNPLLGRCNPYNIKGTVPEDPNAPAAQGWGGQKWVRTDCRDDSFYVALNTPVIPIDNQIAQSNNLVDIDGSWLSYLWW